MGVRRLLAGLCKGVVATAAMFGSTSYGPGVVDVASRDPFYGVAHERLIALARNAERRWASTPATARATADAPPHYRPPEPLEHDGKVRTGELLAALGKD